ncbi:MAG: PEP-utilizing enzyme [Dehalococcoidia bacterium]
MTGRPARFWFWDPSHFPRPVTPAAETFDLPAMAAGFAAAAAELRRPLAGQYVRVERGYVYFGVDVPRSQEELASREAAYHAAVAPLVDSALSDWTERYAPEAERLTRALWSLAGDRGDDAGFAAALDEAVTLRTGQWRAHDLALVPAMEAAARFTSYYADHLGGVAAAQTSLQGFPNRATEAAEALESFAETVRERPDIVRSLVDGVARPASADAVTDRWFRDALQRFLHTYGQRSEGWDVGTPTWSEDPSPVLLLLREHLRRPPAQPGAHRRRATQQREAATGRALRDLPDDERPAFLRSLQAAQAYVVVSEDHNALIDQQGMAALRAVLLAAGRRLSINGRVATPEDAVWLTRAELQAALRGSRTGRHLPARRRSLQRRRALTHPARILGRPLPAWAAANPTLADFFGLGAEPAVTPNRLQGTGVSPGVATGRACIVRSLDEIDALEPDDILVCPTTSPAWTPWLGLIAGAVVETGGMLSHTAVLAREYGIPCAVNVRDATSTIPNGAEVHIDGATGAVTW